MSDLARLYAEIALLRRGPQDVPASLLLLAVTVLGYCAVNLAIDWLLPTPNEPWLPILAIGVVFTLCWYATLLTLLRRRERLLQTTTAVFGYRTVLSPASVVSEWLIRRFGADATWQLPLIVLYVAVAVWMIAVNSHILKAALEWSTLQCVALVVLEILAGGLIVIAIVPLRP